MKKAAMIKNKNEKIKPGEFAPSGQKLTELWMDWMTVMGNAFAMEMFRRLTGDSVAHRNKVWKSINTLKAEMRGVFMKSYWSDVLEQEEQENNQRSKKQKDRSRKATGLLASNN